VEENFNEFDEFEIDEATMKMLEKKYRGKIFGSVLVLLFAIVVIVFSFFAFAGNLDIMKSLNNVEALKQSGMFQYALGSYERAEKKSNDNPLTALGETVFFGKLEMQEKAFGPVSCKKLLDEYYPDSKYPQFAIKYLENAKIYTQAFKELNNLLLNDAKDYVEAYEGIEKISTKNPQYPKYLILYFHLLATQKFEQNAKTQLAAYKALVREAPDATWLYEFEGTRTLISANELTEAFRLCPQPVNEEAKMMKVSILRLMGEYKNALMLCDEFYDYNDPSELLDREKLIIYLIKGDARSGIDFMSRYVTDLSNCETAKMLYTLQIAAIKANDKKLDNAIAKHLKDNKLPASETVAKYRAGELTVSDIFLNVESDLS